MTKVVRRIELEFTTGMGEMTTAQIVALCVAQVEGVLTQERIRGRIDSYDARVVRPPVTVETEAERRRVDGWLAQRANAGLS